MGIKELKEKASKSTLLTGAAKIATTTTLIAALIVGAPTVAHADVPASNIVGDAETWEDRSDIKVQDGVDIRDYFEGYNRYGESYVTEDEVRKAIELSDALNAYSSVKSSIPYKIFSILDFNLLYLSFYPQYYILLSRLFYNLLIYHSTFLSFVKSKQILKMFL